MVTDPDPIAVAVEAAPTPPLAEAAAEVDAWARAMAGRAVNGWDFTSVGPGPDHPKLRLRSLRVLADHAAATGEPCDGERCETGGAAHCHRCADAESTRLLRERDGLRASIDRVRSIHRHVPCGNARCSLGGRCIGCDPDCCGACSDHPWPCPTVLALEPDAQLPDMHSAWTLRRDHDAVAAERNELRRRINAVRREVSGWNSAYGHLKTAVRKALDDPIWSGDPRWAAVQAEVDECEFTISRSPLDSSTRAMIASATGGHAVAREVRAQVEDAAVATFAWGESVARDHDRILVPLNTGDTYTADLVLDPAGAQTLADMLHDAAGPEPCPYGDGSCPLDAREHYHLARAGRADLVVCYGDDEDRRAFPPNGRLGR